MLEEMLNLQNTYVNSFDDGDEDEDMTDDEMDNDEAEGGDDDWSDDEDEVA